MIFISPMHLEDFVELIDGTCDDYIVKLAYKHEPTEPYTIDNELLLWDFELQDHCWQNDWYEGQEYVAVLAYIKLEDVTF